MSKLKVDAIDQGPGGSGIAIGHALTTNGITNSSGVVNLGTQTGFTSAGIDDNETSTKRITIATSSPHVTVTGTLNATTDIQVAGTSLAATKPRAWGKIAFSGQMTTAGAVSNLTATVSNSLNFTSSSVSGATITVNFDSSEFDGTLANFQYSVVGAIGGDYVVRVSSITQNDASFAITLQGFNESGGTQGFSGTLFYTLFAPGS